MFWGVYLFCVFYDWERVARYLVLFLIESMVISRKKRIKAPDIFNLWQGACYLPQRNGPVCLVRIGSFCMRRTFVCVAPNQHFDRCTHSKIFLKIFFKNFPVCIPEMCSGYVRRRKRTSSNLQKGGMRHDVSL